MNGAVSYILSKIYTDNSLKGISGTLAGKNCTISKTEEVEGGTNVTFTWTADDGTKKNTTIFVKDGEKGIDGKDGKDGEQGETGVSIVGAHFNSNGKIVFELSDGSETAPVSLPSASVDISPDSGNVIEQRANGIFVPETDTSNFVKKEENKGLISDEEKAQIALNKSAIETLNGDESVVGSVAKQIAEALGKINSLSKEIVDAVPSVADAKDNVIYLLKGEGTTYEMYTVVSLPDGSKNMASLGSTEIDLNGYLTVTKAQELYVALADVDKDTLAKLGTVTEGEVIYLTFNGSKILTLSQIESIVYKKSEVDALLEAKLDKSAVVKSLDSTKTDDEIPSAKCVFDELEGKINSNYGSVNAGKALVINEEGNVVPGDVAPANTFDAEDFSVDGANEVSLLPARRVYHGTRAAWDSLSVAEKTQYGATAFTDDEATLQGTPELITSQVQTGPGYSSGDIVIQKLGHFVQLDLHSVVTTGLEKDIYTGLPKPSNVAPYFIVQGDGDPHILGLGNIRAEGILWSGTSTAGMAAGIVWDGTIMYFTND